MSSKRTAMIERRTQKHRAAAARAYDGFVRTPAPLADDLVSGHRDIGSTPRGALWLEPSAGDGRIVRAIIENDRDAHVIAVEPNEERADALDALAAEHPGRVTVVRARFEDYADRHTGEPFDAVVMNPPWGDSSRDLVWIDHVRRAWDMLRPGALLVSIVPPSYATSGFRAQRDFRAWAESHGATFERLDGQPFAESGTGTHAGVLTVPRAMPSRPDGLPTWLYTPAAGVPVAVPGAPIVTAVGALTMPVQEYDDRAGARPRVIRYAGTCYGCVRPVWVHDDRGDANVWEASTIDAAENGHAGPSVVLCMECYTGNADAHAGALRDVAAHWTPDPDADPLADTTPPVYPLDLGAGSWATVRGIDSRGWVFTLTGRVMTDPERVADLGDVAFPNDRIAVTLRTVRGLDVELYALEDARVILRDVPGDVVPAPCGEPIPFGMPQPAGMPARARVVADNARAHLTPVEQLPPSATDTPADPFVSGWVQAAIPGVPAFTH
jgi:predicted RNA methylase